MLNVADDIPAQFDELLHGQRPFGCVCLIIEDLQVADVVGAAAGQRQGVVQ